MLFAVLRQANKDFFVRSFIVPSFHSSRRRHSVFPLPRSFAVRVGAFRLKRNVGE